MSLHKIFSQREKNKNKCPQLDLSHFKMSDAVVVAENDVPPQLETRTDCCSIG